MREECEDKIKGDMGKLIEEDDHIWPPKIVKIPLTINWSESKEKPLEIVEVK